MRKNFIWVLVIVIMAGLGAAILTGLVYLTQINPQKTDGVSFGSDPIVTIIQPADQVHMTSGDALLVHVTAESQGGLKQLELLIDNQVVQTYTLPDPSVTSLSRVFVVLNQNTGWHGITAKATNRQNQTGVSNAIDVAMVVQPANDASSDGQGFEEAGNIQPAGDGQGNPPAGGGDADNNPPAGGENAGNNPPVGDGQANPPAGGEDLAANDEALPALPPQPNDAPPQFLQYDLHVELGALGIFQRGGEPVPTLLAYAKAEDDLGLRSLKFTFTGFNREGWIDRVTNQIDCEGQQVCEIGYFHLPLEVGQYWAGFTAEDTSGHVSLVIDQLQVLPGGNLPPAAVEPESENTILDNIINMLPNLDPGNFLPIDPVISVDNLVDWLGQANAGEDAPEEVCPQDDWECVYGAGIVVTVNESNDPEGNRITLRLEQPFEAPQGETLIPHIQKSIVNNSSATWIIPPHWVAGQGSALNPGTEFSYIDTDLACGGVYEYTVLLQAVTPGAVEAYLSGGAHPNYTTLAWETVQAGGRCDPNDPGPLVLVADPQPGGVMLEWSIPPGNYPAEGAGVILYRYDRTNSDPSVFAEVNLYEEVYSQEDLRPGLLFTDVDPNVICGHEYVYSLGVYPANNRPGFGSDGWLQHTSQTVMRGFCPAGSLSDIQFTLEPTWEVWEQGSYQEVLMTLDLPQGFVWPAGEDVRLNIWQVLEDGSAESPGYFPKNNLRHRTFTAPVDCLKDRAEFFLSLESDGVRLQESEVYSVAVEDCAPQNPPTLISVVATNDCGGPEKCLVINWAPYQVSNEPGYLSVDSVFIQQKGAQAPNPQWKFVGLPIAVPTDQTSYIQTDAWCNTTYYFRMGAINDCGPDCERITTTSFIDGTSIQITTPGCDVPWSLIATPEGEENP